MGNDVIDQISRQYNKYSLWVISATTLIGLLAINIFELRQLVNPLVVSVIYALLSSVSLGISWKFVAQSSPKALGRFYLASSAIRMLIAVIVVLVFCVIAEGRSAILNFIVVFSSFYMVMLVFDGVFFARAEKGKKQRI